VYRQRRCGHGVDKPLTGCHAVGIDDQIAIVQIFASATDPTFKILSPSIGLIAVNEGFRQSPETMHPRLMMADLPGSPAIAAMA
jgi:hypothetical protein